MGSASMQYSALDCNLAAMHSLPSLFNPGIGMWKRENERDSGKERQIAEKRGEREEAGKDENDLPPDA